MTFSSVWGDSNVTKMRVTSALQLIYIYSYLHAYVCVCGRL